MVIYIDAGYILAQQLVSLPLSYLDYLAQLSIFPTEEDIYYNAVERCLAHDSFIFALMRGKLHFMLVDEHRYDGTILSSILVDSTWRYVVVLPFVVIFGRFISAKYNIHWLAGAGVGFLAFAAAIQGYDHFEARIRTFVADNSDCHNRMADEVAKEYRPEILAKQV